ncbi:MAG: heme-binding protein [Clostridia bacterium]|nr:heme-binding protein [Clostridia bacterium]
MEEKIISDVVKSVINSMQNKKVTLEIARKLIHKVELKAKEMGVNAVVAVANDGGNIVAVECMDDSYIASYDIAVNKAFTCAALKMPTTTLKKLAQPGQDLYGIQFTNNGRIVIFGGGVPLCNGDKTIGGLGVSGGSEEQDTLLAEYGERVFLEELL